MPRPFNRPQDANNNFEAFNGPSERTYTATTSMNQSTSDSIDGTNGETVVLVSTETALNGTRKTMKIKPNKVISNRKRIEESSAVNDDSGSDTDVEFCDHVEPVEKKVSSTARD